MKSLILTAILIIGSFHREPKRADILTKSASEPKCKSTIESWRPQQQNHRSAIHAGDVLGSGKLLHYVRPKYPEQLRRRHVEGVVEIKVLVGKDGVPKKLTPLRGPKELVPYAVAAVKRWRYEPTLINGSPTEFLTEVHIPFTSSP